MTFRLQGADARLDFNKRWLVFSWGHWDDYAGSSGGQLFLPPERCVSIAGRLSGPDGSLCLAFRFRPTEVGGGDIVAEIVFGPDWADRAWRFAEWFAHEYRVEGVSAPGRDAEPSAAEREDAARDWLSAPVSPTTRALFRSVMARLPVADS
ncbi:hypothetical protein ABZ078_10190 [Streptomyces sp. NPDC006385]|uniref:hypothetical protein n=1 Tax=Streptomyces sp. NPDC006385 TaxID=3156761 RepID=UPI0033AFC7D8